MRGKETLPLRDHYRAAACSKCTNTNSCLCSYSSIEEAATSPLLLIMNYGMFPAQLTGYLIDLAEPGNQAGSVAA